MPIKPKYGTTKSSSGTYQKLFTDRMDLKNSFSEKIRSLKSDDINVMNFFGVGGIGKSTLKKEFIKILQTEKNEFVWSGTDFETIAYREPETSLFLMRKELREKFGIEFIAFDIAYTVYWQKTHPQISITKDNLPFFEEGSIISGLLSGLGGVPVIGLIPTLADAFHKGKKHLKSWWTKRGQKELFNISTLSSKEILDRLPMYFALDLKDYLNSHKKKAVIFIDTYEGLWENNYLEGSYFIKDEWVRELVSQLPGILWVILGREKLLWQEIDKDWLNFIEYHSLDGLSENDSKEYLTNAGILNENIKNTIYKSSSGVPYFLDLAVDTFYSFKDKYSVEPEIKDFATTQKEVLTRFLKYLDKNEIETLKVLSVPREWNFDIFSLLVSEFKTGYPLTSMKILCRFSFIHKVQDDVNGYEKYKLHELMRTGLNEVMENPVLFKIHQTMYDYYSAKLKNLELKNIVNEDILNFYEAFYHAKFVLDYNTFFKWTISESQIFIDAAKWNSLIPVFEELLKYIKDTKGENTLEFAEATKTYSSVLYNLGLYDRAIDLVEDKLNSLKELLGADNLSFSALLNNLGAIYYYKGSINKSIELFEESIKIRKKILGENDRRYADTIDNLAIVYSNLGEFEKAIPLHLKAVEIYKNILGENHVHYAVALNNLAYTYRNTGQSDEAKNLLLKSLKIVQTAVGENHPKYATALHNLAEQLMFSEDLVNAYEYFNKAYNLRLKLLGKLHSLTLVTLSNIGIIHLKRGEVDIAINIFSETLDIFSSTVGNKHHFYAFLLIELGKSYKVKNDFAKSKDYFIQAKEIYKNIFGENHGNTKEIDEYLNELNE